MKVTNKDIAQLLKKAAAQGFIATISGGGHLKVKCPDGSLIFDTTTRLDPRGFRNFRQRMRRAGFVG